MLSAEIGSKAKFPLVKLYVVLELDKVTLSNVSYDGMGVTHKGFFKRHF